MDSARISHLPVPASVRRPGGAGFQACGIADFPVGNASSSSWVRRFGNLRYSRLGSLRYGARRAWLGLVLALGLAATTLVAQTYVTPMMGGGQTAASMVHTDIYYDAQANVLSATVDDSYGTPELRALDPAQAFDPQQPYAVLNGGAYNFQYGWNAGGLFSVPTGAAIWIELLDCTPNLQAYSGSGRTGTYAPIFGTAGSSRLWKWSGAMVHNTYAVAAPPIGRLFADYHIYFGDASTGSRAGFTDRADTTVHLEWTTVPVENPMAFKFGALADTSGAPLCFINADQFLTNSLAVVNLAYTNASPGALPYGCPLTLMAVPAKASNGGPAISHAALGARLELEFVSLQGPPRASLEFWEPGQTQPAFSLAAGDAAGTNRVPVSQTQTTPTADPYGCVPGRQIAASQPGLYSLGFRLVDTSTNGPGAGPVHAASPVYQVYLQAGLTIASLSRQGDSVTVRFGGEPGKTYSLERSPALGPAADWHAVAGPLAGTNCLQTLTDPTATGIRSFFRLHAL
jgi:hypothetical protein